jgi:hypothetical protein
LFRLLRDQDFAECLTGESHAGRDCR